MEHRIQFDQQIFREECNAQWIGNPFIFFEDIGSTNQYLKQQLAHLGTLSSGTLALTDYQSAGRGRLGRQWIAPPRTALLVSVALRPSFSPVWLSMIVGLAAVEALAQPTAQLKWPNDVMIVGQDGIWRKIAGILVELQTDGNGQVTAILGMGLNVNIEATDLPASATPATSVLVERGVAVSRERLLARWVERLEWWVDSAELGNSPQPAWNKNLITLNQPVTVRGGLTINGIAEGTDEWGRLLVRDSDGNLHACAAGDVTLRRASVRGS